MAIFIGCAGWQLRKEHAGDFPGAGTHLQRYAARFNAVEINSSFYRSHRPATYERWAACTPQGFRFSVKLPKQITHVRRLIDVDSLVDQFCAETAGLGGKLGVVLVQLPPSLRYAPAVVEHFFGKLRSGLTATVACEPRHASWFEQAAESMLVKHEIERVAVDPPLVPAASLPGGRRQQSYFRWHGSPHIYYSNYCESRLVSLAQQLIESNNQRSATWCIFDNTAEGFATTNALFLNGWINRAVAGNPTTHVAGNQPRDDS